MYPQTFTLPKHQPDINDFYRNVKNPLGVVFVSKLILLCGKTNYLLRNQPCLT